MVQEQKPGNTPADRLSPEALYADHAALALEFEDAKRAHQEVPASTSAMFDKWQSTVNAHIVEPPGERLMDAANKLGPAWVAKAEQQKNELALAEADRIGPARLRVKGIMDQGHAEQIAIADGMVEDQAKHAGRVANELYGDKWREQARQEMLKDIGRDADNPPK